MSLVSTKCRCPSVMSNQPFSSRCCCFGIIAFHAVGVLLAFCWRSVGVWPVPSVQDPDGGKLEIILNILPLYIFNISGKCFQEDIIPKKISWKYLLALGQSQDPDDRKARRQDGANLRSTEPLLSKIVAHFPPQVPASAPCFRPHHDFVAFNKCML